MFIVTETPSQALELASNLLITKGELSSPREIKTLEILNASIEITKPWNIPLHLLNRKLNQEIGAKETLQLVGQTSDPEAMVNISKTFVQFTDGGIFHGSYGNRVYGNLTKLVALLQKDSFTRQAVLTIFDSNKDLNADVKDVPCTLSLQYFVRDNKLIARTSMRSNDVYLGMPYDFVQFIGLQGAIAKSLGIEMGSYFHTVGSLHLYEKHLPEAKLILANPDYYQEQYSPLWSDSNIEQISSLARKILKGEILNNLTDFEKFLGATNVR